MDVRPHEREGGANGTSAPDDSSEESTSEATAESGEHDAEEEFSSQEEWLDEYREEMGAGQSEAPESGSAAVQSDERPVLGPLLESLRAAIEAQTVCLLVQEEVVLDYEIAALASAQPGVQREGSFETQTPLLSAAMSRRPVTVRTVDEEERADLKYYETIPDITQVAVAPLDRPDTSASVFILVDATAETELDTSQVRSFLKRYVELVGHVLDAKEAEARQTHEPAQEAVGATEAEAAVQDRPAPETADREGAAGAPDHEGAETPRPRREIIAEEMEAADVASDPLALVLVLLNRYESVARQGEDAVERAERHFRSRLEDLAPGQRVERFGELNYGVFVRRDVEAVEPWVLDLQEALGRETGELEGGVSVGVAVRDAHHTPEELRADATEALLEAYETGECAIKA